MTDRLITGFLSNFLPSSLLWHVPTQEKVVYLTFDDGPIPELTHELLGMLGEFEAEATFFCVGENVKKYPEIYREILRCGHSVGNHTQQHVKGWRTPYREYLANVEEASRFVDSKLYRPPYGLITWKQARALSKNYQVVMWSLLTRDYDPSVTREQCLEITINGVRPGAIIVFHDNLKAREKVLFVLPRLLEFLKREGYKAKKLNMDGNLY